MPLLALRPEPEAVAPKLDPGWQEIVELIIEKGGDVHLANCVGDVPLHMAASDDSVELIHILVQKGTNVNHKGFVSRTPLHSAAAAGQLNAIRTLIELKADVEAKDSKGATAVDYAQKKGFAEAENKIKAKIRC